MKVRLGVQQSCSASYPVDVRQWADVRRKSSVMREPPQRWRHTPPCETEPKDAIQGNWPIPSASDPETILTDTPSISEFCPHFSNEEEAFSRKVMARTKMHKIKREL